MSYKLKGGIGTVGSDIETIKGANYSKLKTSKYMRIKEISNMLGAKWQ